MTGPTQDFWVIAAYFNLTNGLKRLENFRCFRRRLPVPLLAVEWHPSGRFQLKDGDADVLLHVGGGDLMWQKERLLRIAIEALPDEVAYVAWIDSDVLFEDTRWHVLARNLLDKYSVVQLFSQVAFPDESASLRLARSEQCKLDGIESLALPTRESFVSTLMRLKKEIVGFDLDRRFQPDETGSYNIMRRPGYGFAWAAHCDFIRKINIYDRCIMGGGDLLFCYGISGLSQELIENHRKAGWAFYGDCASYRQWAARAAAVSIGRLGCLNGNILHLFHGDLAKRQYKARIDGLVPFALDLDRDICAEAGQPWSWQRDRNVLNQYFMRYLCGREEDAPSSCVRSDVGMP